MTQHHIKFLLLVRKFRLLLAWIMLFAFFSSLYFLAPLVLRYSSHASFYVVADKLYNPASAIVQDNVGITEHSLENKRIENLIYSSEMMTHLVKNYNLYVRYEIDSADRFGKEMMANEIRNNVRINKTSYDFFQVYVYDRNNEVAAAMANSIVKQLDHLNRQYIKNKVAINLKMFSEFMAESNRMNSEHSNNLKELLSDLKKAKSSSPETFRNEGVASDIEYSLYDAVNMISQITIQNLNSQAYLFNSIKMMDQAKSPTIVLVGRALPDTSSTKLLLIVYSAGVALALLILSVTVLYLTYYYKQELNIIFGRNQSTSTNSL